MELACIRWFPAHVLYLTFFTNTVLLACFLGMSLGCLAAEHPRNYLLATPVLLAVAMLMGLGGDLLSNFSLVQIDVGHQQSPQEVFFGTEPTGSDPNRLVVPIEVLAGTFFLLLALAFVGPGQMLGRAFNRMPSRLWAYTLNILGSLTGIVLFGLSSWLWLSPFWWLLVIALLLGYFLAPRHYFRWLALAAAPAAAVWLAGLTSGPFVPHGELVAQHIWSPYYRIDYYHERPWPRFIDVNLIGHQEMRSREETYPAYALPHLLNRDSGGKPFGDVLIIGAGSGNDVSRALQWGATSVDAVEIDPVIQRLGALYHPDKPYEDPHVRVHLDDGRNFLRAGDRQYDLVVYALVDSLVLHSGYSNIRLESYLFTEQALQDVRRHLKPGGLFVMYNYFRQGWLVSRLHQELSHVFERPPVVLMLPYRDEIHPEDDLIGDNFTVFLAGDTQRMEEQFQKHPAYWLSRKHAPRPERSETPNGFTQSGDKKDGWIRIGPAVVEHPEPALRPARDDWPFLYLHEPMLPALSLRGMVMMGGLALLLLFWFLPRRRGAAGRWSFDGRMFFLGAGFMLIETKAVVHMALLFGSTWMVSSLVFFAVLVMILGANLFVLRFRPRRLWPMYAGLFAVLVLNGVLPLDFFLGMSRPLQVIGSCLLVAAPILFAGVIFAVAFDQSREPDRAFGANIAGAMLGGLAEYLSMLLGFQLLVLVAVGFYALSLLLAPRAVKEEPKVI
jgi:SAM-dependent methyltransferase